jgi:hypothetical protein
MRASTALRTGVGAGGVAMLGFGVWNLLWHKNAQVGPPASVGKWLLGGVIGHDAVIAPLVFLACAVAWRCTGARVRRALALFLLAGGSLAIVGLPDILRSGDNPNPTVTPLDYPRNLAIALGAVAVIAVLSVVPGAARDRRSRVREARLRAQAEAEAAEAALKAKEQAMAQRQARDEVRDEARDEVRGEAADEAAPAPERPPTEENGDPEDG